MKFDGQAIKLRDIDNNCVELNFDLQGESVNKFGSRVFEDLEHVITMLEADKGIKGVLVTSAKDVFFVGADINEFGGIFSRGEEGIKSSVKHVNSLFNRFEDLDCPTVVAINGYALGGGLEFCLACDYRLLASHAKVGLPETKLGIIPGWGGTVRLSRLAGVDVAVEWIAGGTENRADVAFKSGVVDGVIEPDQLRDVSIQVLNDAISGDLDYKTRKAQKKGPLKHNGTESLLSFESSKAFVKAKAGRNYPAPVAAITSMQQGATFSRDDALNVETDTFAKMAQTPAAASLIGLFQSDQLLGKKAKQWQKKAAAPINNAAVLGAGIMGGGIAYQSAYKGVAIKMKDIAQQGVQLGLSEASKLLAKLVDRGRISNIEMANVLSKIDGTLSYDNFDEVDVVVEAVVENPKVKKSVLAEVEPRLNDNAVLCSNTSTISITALSQALSHPERFCGMHFFNPVHRMPLVEIIRGEKTSDATIARTVAYALALGKKAIVVNDCPGFLVNRVLFPYFAGFAMLLRDGADFQAVDKVMERWGWPMGPAYLMDVVGIDTGVHAQAVMAEGFPERMSKDFKAASDIMFEAKRFGQKTDAGFYAYRLDKKGKSQKVEDKATYELLKPHVAQSREFEDEEIIARMMIPMATELARCLEEGIVESAAEADMALIYGLGFPPFRGGVFRWVDSLGAKAFVDMTQKYEHLGKIYEATDGMKARASENTPYYTTPQVDKGEQ